MVSLWVIGILLWAVILCIMHQTDQTIYGNNLQLALLEKAVTITRDVIFTLVCLIIILIAGYFV
jgi:hypothetical protein